MKKFNLLSKLFVGILIGISIGSIFHHYMDYSMVIFILRIIATFSDLFSKFLSFIIPILILSFVSSGLADLGQKANKLFGITIILAYSSTIISGVFAYFCGAKILPLFAVQHSANLSDFDSFKILIDIDIQPVFGVMTSLILAFILGLGMANTKGQILNTIILEVKKIIELVLSKTIMPLIPVYVASVFCNISATGKLMAITKMFAIAFVLTIILQIFYIVFQFIVASVISGKNQIVKLKNCIPAYFTALGTQSSAMTIPVSVKCSYNNNVKKEIADFTIPLCATIHLDGDTIALVIGTMAVSLASGCVIPTFLDYLPFIFMLGIIMVAAPGVPGGGVMAALGIIESMLGFGTSLQSLIIGFHFAQDSFGTATNVTGDQAIAIIVDELNNKNNNTT